MLLCKSQENHVERSNELHDPVSWCRINESYFLRISEVLFDAFCSLRSNNSKFYNTSLKVNNRTAVALSVSHKSNYLWISHKPRSKNESHLRRVCVKINCSHASLLSTAGLFQYTLIRLLRSNRSAVRCLISSQAYYRVHVDSGEHVLTDSLSEPVCEVTYLRGKSFKFVPRSISIKGPGGILSHHLLETSQVYFGERGSGEGFIHRRRHQTVHVSS